MYRRRRDGIEVLLVHPGGPFWAKKDLGAWSIPKGEYSDRRTPSPAPGENSRRRPGARPQGEFVPLGEIVQRGGKLVTAFAIEGDFDVATLRSNSFEIEWPPKSGRRQTFPEVDRAAWFSLADARKKILPAQAEFMARLIEVLGRSATTMNGRTGQMPVFHITSSLRRNAFGFSTSNRSAMRRAARTCSALRLSIAGCSRDRQCANGWCGSVIGSSSSRSLCAPSRLRRRCASPIHILAKRGQSGTTSSI